VEDITRIKNAIARFLLSHHNKKQLIKDISDTYYNFDKVALEKMKKHPYDKVVKELHDLAKGFVKIGTISTDKFEFPNILMPCSNDTKNPDYCSKKKFIIKKQELDDILNVIAYDITNPAKWKWLFHSAFVNRTVDFYIFIRRPSETISVEFLQK
jgi:hypothetical protein